MISQQVLDYAQVIHLLGFLASIGAASLVLWRRGRDKWLKKKKERKIAAAAEPEAPYKDPPATSPMGLRYSPPTLQRCRVQQAEGRLWPCCWAKRPTRGQEHGSFLRSAGTVHLILDLIVSAVRISYICIQLEADILHYRWLRGHEYLAGLAVETSFLQALWLLYTHFRIVACVRRREIKVTGTLFRPLCFATVVWLSVGLGPVILADCLGISQVRDPVSTAGALLGFVLLIYLLFAYHSALRAFQDTTNEAARRIRDLERGRGSQDGADGGARAIGRCTRETLRRCLCACVTAVDDMLQELFPDLADGSDEDQNLSDRSFSLKNSWKGTAGSPVASLSGEGKQPQVSKVEQRLRESLRRVLKVYVATFICVICAGLVAGDQKLANSTAG